MKGYFLPFILAYACSIVEAGIFLKAKDPHIVQGVCVIERIDLQTNPC